ncbi:cerato-ulmin [Daldinia vernicosa]|uniref:cerato-ulmin n=1 Tax=Daldinia vernicosa TaxID=114800 RepID=UPI002008B4F9|nr:cerato-ulmin [Daldinia vernicosa]KAI0851932.1 cerato-ulmin [Daldinia vernicosa]
MQLSTFFVTFLATAVLANPTKRGYETAYDPCSGLEDTPQCCATDVLGIADLDCAAPSLVPVNAPDFKNICAAVGKQARCCLLPLLNQDIACSTPAGV